MSRGHLRRATVATFVSLLLLAPLASSVALDGETTEPLAATADAKPVPLRLDVTGILDVDDLVGPSAMHATVPADGTGLGPGSLLHIGMAGGAYICTANFIWKDTSNKLYLGSAGHCFLPATKKATHGPGADYDPALTTVRVCVDACSIGSNIPDLRRATWVDLGNPEYARQTGSGGDIGNDFGIIEIPTSAHGWLRPNMPVFNGPTTTGTATLGKTLCHYGHGFVYGETFATEARVGSAWTTGPNSFTAVLTIAGGDSGSAIQTCERDADGLHGRAATGIITHGVGVPVANAVAPLNVALGYGTTVARAQVMAQEAGYTITPVLSTI